MPCQVGFSGPDPGALCLKKQQSRARLAAEVPTFTVMPRHYGSGMKGGTAATWMSGEAILSIPLILVVCNPLP